MYKGLNAGERKGERDMAETEVRGMSEDGRMDECA